MSTLDAGFYFVEHDNVPMHLGSLVVFEGPVPCYDDLAQLYTSKLPLVPRYRQVVRTMPFQLFRPVWIDDEHFDIRHHLRRVTVSPPGGGRQLRELAAHIFARRLDRSKPLWEGWLLEGLTGGRWALISKVHHCMVDGVGGTDLMTEVFDVAPLGERVEPAPWQPEPAPSLADLLAGGVRDTVTRPLRQLAGVPGLIRQRLPTPEDLVGFGRGLTDSARRACGRAGRPLPGAGLGPGRR